MKEPIVTVIVPAYQRLPFLREALKSALGQTYRDFELIVSDDGDSSEIADYVASLKDSRIRYRSNTKRLGIAMNNFAAFSEARGRYIASLHDDDVWEPTFLSVLVPLIESNDDVTVVFCDHHLIDESGRILPGQSDSFARWFKRKHLQPGLHRPFIKPAVINSVIPMVMAAVFRKSILDGVEYSSRVGGSYDLWLAYLAVKDGHAVYYVSQQLTRYRMHQQQGTFVRGVRNLRDGIYVRRKILAAPEIASFRDEMRNGLGVFYGKMALYFLGRHSFWRGKIFLKEALSLLNRPKNILALVVNSVVVVFRGTKRWNHQIPGRTPCW